MRKTVYSPTYVGNESNYDQQVRFDNTGGYLGITQYGDSLQRVLLTPQQVKRLTAFIGKK
jgi:hypothetical protein